MCRSCFFCCFRGGKLSWFGCTVYKIWGDTFLFWGGVPGCYRTLPKSIPRESIPGELCRLVFQGWLPKTSLGAWWGWSSLAVSYENRFLVLFFRICVPQNRSFLCYMISIYYIICIFQSCIQYAYWFISWFVNWLGFWSAISENSAIFDRCMFVCVTAATTDRSSVILCNLCGHAYYIHISPPHIYREKPPENGVFESEET